MGGRLLLKTLFLTSPIGTTAVSVSMLSRTTLPLARIVQPLAFRGSVDALRAISQPLPAACESRLQQFRQ